MWEQLVKIRQQALHASWLCGGIGVAVAIAGFFGFVPQAPLATIFTLLSAHALTAWILLGQLARLQARLDMRKIALDAQRSEPLVTERLNLCVGDTYEMRARDGTRFAITPNREVGITVEYLG